MTASPANSSRINESHRCAQIFSNGKRCRLPANPNSALCPKHAGTEAEDLAATLTGGLDEFTSATPINQFLSRLLLLLAHDRISPRRGAVMAYTANLLLRTVSVMQQESAEASDPKTGLSKSSGIFPARPTSGTCPSNKSSSADAACSSGLRPHGSLCGRDLRLLPLFVVGAK